MAKKIYHGFAVDRGIDPVKIMDARKDIKFQVWLIWMVDNAMRGIE